MKTGIELITAERQRQLQKLGWTTEHDDTHTLGELTEAATCYAAVGSATLRGSSPKYITTEMFDGDSILHWPWEDEAYKPADSAEENLIKAGALIVAELDRLQRLKHKGKEETDERPLKGPYETEIAVHITNGTDNGKIGVGLSMGHPPSQQDIDEAVEKAKETAEAAGFRLMNKHEFFNQMMRERLGATETFAAPGGREWDE